MMTVRTDDGTDDGRRARRRRKHGARARDVDDEDEEGDDDDDDEGRTTAGVGRVWWMSGWLSVQQGRLVGQASCAGLAGAAQALASKRKGLTRTTNDDDLTRRRSRRPMRSDDSDKG